MPATSANSRSGSSTRSRLPLTPKVTTSRRGGHVATRPVRTSGEATANAATPEIHITPNVVSAARGGLGLPDLNLSDAAKSRAVDMRGARI